MGRVIVRDVVKRKKGFCADCGREPGGRAHTFSNPGYMTFIFFFGMPKYLVHSFFVASEMEIILSAFRKEYP